MGTSDITLTAIWTDDDSGTCGDNLNWAYDASERKLTISGSGAMNDYSSTNYPWFYYRNEITTLVLSSGMTTIGNNAFNGCSAMTGTLTIPDTVTTIGAHAFDGCTGFSALTIGSSVKSIGDYAFKGCTGFTNALTIPASVTTVVSI